MNNFGKFVFSVGMLAAVTAPCASFANPSDIGNKNPITASVAWMQTAAEYDALCYQTYNSAKLSIDENIRTGSYVKKDGKLCAEVLQTLEDGTSVRFYKPVAIVLDIDETVIDNSGAEAWLIKNGQTHNNENWSAWCFYQGAEPKACKEVPGAVDFLKYCMEIGVTPIYLTDRDESVRQPTLKALENLGLGHENLNDCLILQSRPRDIEQGKNIIKSLSLTEDSDLGTYILNNDSKKAGRRTAVQLKYKVIGWFGDNLYDMPVEVPKTLKAGKECFEARDAEVAKHRSKLGSTFFILPNATYGSWMKANTVNPEDMAQFVDDYGFGEWYKLHKNELKGGSTR